MIPAAEVGRKRFLRGRGEMGARERFVTDPFPHPVCPATLVSNIDGEKDRTRK